MTTWQDQAREYARNHKRVRQTFGKASDYQCYLCFDRAEHWAHLWRTHDPADPYGYIPLCRQDHLDYDQRSPEMREQARLTADDTARERRMRAAAVLAWNRATDTWDGEDSE